MAARHQFQFAPIPPARIVARNLRSDLDLTQQELGAVLELAAEVKRRPGDYTESLRGNYISLLFEKPSLRTRLTFELAIKQLGGDHVTSAGPIGDREPLKDVARNLDRWTNAIVARTFKQETIDGLAQWASVPVVNALSDMYHPCQALADVFTLQEHFGEVRGLKLAFVGDGNNVAHSLMLCAARLGMDFAIGCPKGYEPEREIVTAASYLAELNGSGIEVTNDAAAAVCGAHAVYTDVWASMGQEDEKEQRLADFAPFPVNGQLFGKARPDAMVLHCLPA